MARALSRLRPVRRTSVKPPWRARCTAARRALRTRCPAALNSHRRSCLGSQRRASWSGKPSSCGQAVVLDATVTRARTDLLLVEPVQRQVGQTGVLCAPGSVLGAGPPPLPQLESASCPGVVLVSVEAHGVALEAAGRGRLAGRGGQARSGRHAAAQLRLQLRLSPQRRPKSWQLGSTFPQVTWRRIGDSNP